MSLLRDYLRNDGTLEELKVKYAIDASRHKTYPNLVLLKYNQVESPFAEPLVREARGIILDEAKNWNVVCARWGKFFNYGEGHAATIDWSTSRVQEKVDGSLMTLYFYDNKWHVASSGSPDASGQCGDWPFTFSELFWKTFNEMGLKVPEYPELCPSFELTSKYNRVVVPHKESRLTFIGLHDLEQGEVDPRRMETIYPLVKSYGLFSFDAIVSSFAGIDPLSQEGYVVVDAGFNRVKVKHPGYVALHHLKDGFGPRRIVEVIRASETTEVLTYFPEWTEQFVDTQKRYDDLVDGLNTIYAEIKDIENQKDFALELQKRKPSIPGALYSLRAKQIQSVKEFIADMNIKHLMKILGLKDKKEEE